MSSADCPQEFTAADKPRSALDDRLDRGHWESLHDSLGRLGLHMHNLAEHLALARLGCRFQARLDHANARDHELASLLDLCGGNVSQCSHDFATLRFLELARGGQLIADHTL